jgi:multidrug efflux pump subunit AcrA (membrane-fusion protein)
LAYFWWESSSHATRTASTAAPAKVKQEKRVPVHTLPVQRGTISVQLTAIGDIRAHARVEVFSKAEGHLHALRVEEGDRVQAGQVIAQVADADRQAAVARARAQVQALRVE